MVSIDAVFIKVVFQPERMDFIGDASNFINYGRSSPKHCVIIFIFFLPNGTLSCLIYYEASELFRTSCPKNKNKKRIKNSKPAQTSQLSMQIVTDTIRVERGGGRKRKTKC